jgi:serine/threonine-protein kinase
MAGVTFPQFIGRYRVLGFLGQGAMGTVYRGRDEALERDVALKMMSAGQADAESRARFKREAQAAARLQHPNIVTIYELGEHEGAPYMALELLEGVDLQRGIEAGIRPDPRATLPIVLQLLAGLGHAHEHGIVHRDIKPSNVFLPRDRPVKIMDFGVARLASAMTTTGAVVGTPNYMSPEQVRAGAVDGRSDLFSVGLILYELVTGERAFRGDSIVTLLFKIVHEAPDLSLIPRGDQWERLRAVLIRAIAREPEERYPDARKMAAELSEALKELGGTADPTTAASDLALLVRARPRTGARDADTSAAPAASPKELASASDAWGETRAITMLQGSAGSAAAPASLPEAAGSSVRGGAKEKHVLLLAGALAGASVVALAVGLFVWRQPSSPSSPASPPAAAQAPSAAASGLSPPTPPAAERAPLAVRPGPAVSTPGTTARAGDPKPSAPTPTPATRPAAPASPAPTPSDAPTPSETAVASAPLAPVEQEVVEDTTDNPRLERAEELFAKGRYASALAQAKAVLAREPRNAQAKTLVEDIEVEMVVEGCLDAARRHLDSGDRDAAIAEVRRGLAAKPSDARLLELFREATR